MKDTYKINARCSNCDWAGQIVLQKGEPAGSNMECPNCGCDKAEKDSFTIHPPTLPYKSVRIYEPYPEWPIPKITDPPRKFNSHEITCEADGEYECGCVKNDY